jgi:hypothetical protein
MHFPVQRLSFKAVHAVVEMTTVQGRLLFDHQVSQRTSVKDR